MGRMWREFQEIGTATWHPIAAWFFLRWGFHNPRWPLILVRDCSNAESMLATSCFALLLGNLERATTEPRTVGAGKLCPMESREGCVLFWIWILGQHRFFYELRKRGAVDGNLSTKGFGESLSRTSPKVFQRFQAPRNSGEKEKIHVLHTQRGSK